MNDSTDKHTPTDEFVEYLARDTMRRLRHEARFGTSVSELAPRPRRLPAVFGIAAGVVMTLATGMVLGASANYASAEVLPNGTTTIPSRPTLAILPIRNALSAIGCTQSTQPSAVASKPAPDVIAPKLDIAADQVAVSSARAYPDRAMIAAYAKQYQASVVSGDSVAQHIVMVLDASHNYVWSTHGNGNLTIEVGGDPRTPAERRAYERANQEEFLGKGAHYDFEFTAKRSATDSNNLVLNTYAWQFRNATDSVTGRLKLAGLQLDSAARPGGRKVMRGKGLIQGDTVLLGYAANFTESFSFSRPATDTVPGVYTNGWSRARHGMHFNQASGLHEGRRGDSGLIGLASANVSAAEIYAFPEGEIGPRGVQVMVVHLTPGTTWSGR